MEERCYFTATDSSETERQSPGQLERYRFAAQTLPKGRLLDVACGSGYGTAILSEGRERALGLDIDPKGVEWARAHFAAQADFALIEGSTWPVAARSFDGAASIETLEHVPEAEAPRFLERLADALKPGGRLLITTPLNETEGRKKPDNPFHLREYTWREFDELLSPRFEVLERWSQVSRGATIYNRAVGGPESLQRRLARLVPSGVRARVREFIMDRGELRTVSIQSGCVTGAVAQRALCAVRA